MSYICFVHFRNDKGINVINGDHIPRSHGQDIETDSWKMGDIMVDSLSIYVPVDTPPGSYSMYIGWFDPKTGNRLPLLSGGDEFQYHITLEIIA
jgi:hypothetical protein